MRTVASALNLPRGRYPDPSTPGRDKRQPEPLELAVLALEARDGLELIAAEQVERARELDRLTWEQMSSSISVGCPRRSASAIRALTKISSASAGASYSR